MKTITKTIELYKYDELTEEAQGVAKRWYLDNCREPVFFSDMVVEDLEYMFGKNDLEVEYSLGYCQGDGLNIYGEIPVLQILDAAERNVAMIAFDKFNKILCGDDKKNIRKYAETQGVVNIPSNRMGYCYCYAGSIDYIADYMSAIYDTDNDKFDSGSLMRFNDALVELFTDLCKMYEEWGYDYFYEVDDDTMVEECDGNDWLFTADGNIYFE